MAVKLSPLAGAGWQFFDNLGIPLAGGLLYTYTAGTTTPQATYTSNTGTIANANPIVLDAAGRTANQVWLTTGGAYKFVLQTSAAVTIGTYDNVSGINDFTGAPFAPTAGSTSITTLGTITTGTWNATPIGVAYGGTGLTSIPARSVPVANVANVYTTLTPAAGQSIRINAGNTAWEAYTPTTASSFSGTNGQAFTSSGTFTIPSSITAVKVTVVGGGGGSGSAISTGVCTTASTAGGGGGGTAISYLTGLTPANTLSVTIGAGGTAGTSGSGGTGGSSLVASGTQTITTITAIGGGFSAGVTDFYSGSSGAGGSATNGTINLVGGGGEASSVSASGTGGSSTFGGGARSQIITSTSAGIAGGNYGGGASGATARNGATGLGAAGAGGIVIFEW